MREIALKRLQDGTHNWQTGTKYIPTEQHRQEAPQRMKGNTLGSLINRDDQYRNRQAEGSRGNTNVRGKKWWYNSVTHQRCRRFESPGPEWIQGSPSTITESGRERLKIAHTGKAKSEEHKRKLSQSAKGRTSNHKGTIWVINDQNVRRRVHPDNIPAGFTPVNRKLQ